MASVGEIKTCTKCKLTGATMCYGCQSSFCTDHFNQHRQELSQEVDSICQNYDLLRQDISDDTEIHPLLARINNWEQDSITRIQKAARDARTNLQKLLDQTKNELEKSTDMITAELQSCKNQDDYTENDFKRWKDELDQLRKKFEHPPNIRIQNDNYEEKVINLIQIFEQQQHPTSPSSVPILHENTPPVEKPYVYSVEKFEFYNRTEGVLSENGLKAACSSKSGDGAFIYGCNSYEFGTHDVTFQIVKRGISRIFFGIFSLSKKRVERISGAGENSVYGWWDVDSFILNGTPKEDNKQFTISTDDEITLTLDCDWDNPQIKLYHRRQNRQVPLSIDRNKCPFPWKIIVKLTSNNDCVRILQ